MAVDIKNLVQLIQKKEHAVTSSTSVQDMIDILKAAQKAEGSLIRNYDSAGDLPDAATTNERIAYLSDTRTLRFNNGTWDNPLLGAAGGGSGASSLQGTTSGYRAGGSPTTNIIDNYPFAADANASDVGDLAVTMAELAGANSLTSGYTMGGEGGSPVATRNNIQKYSLTTSGNATDVADLNNSIRLGGSSQSTTHGYHHGGFQPSPPGGKNFISKFEFATDGNATDVGDLTNTPYRPAGHSSTTHGYAAGGGTPPGAVLNVIQKYPFSTDANATDVGDLTVARFDAASNQSAVSGYTSAGNTPPGTNVIDKFPFAADANATDVGDLALNRTYVGNGSSSSTEYGYVHGGIWNPGPTARLQSIEKFSFTTDGNGSLVGDLTNATQNSAGAQV